MIEILGIQDVIEIQISYMEDQIDQESVSTPRGQLCGRFGSVVPRCAVPSMFTIRFFFSSHYGLFD